VVSHTKARANTQNLFMRTMTNHTCEQSYLWHEYVWVRSYMWHGDTYVRLYVRATWFPIAYVRATLLFDYTYLCIYEVMTPFMKSWLHLWSHDSLSAHCNMTACRHIATWLPVGTHNGQWRHRDLIYITPFSHTWAIYATWLYMQHDSLSAHWHTQWRARY